MWGRWGGQQQWAEAVTDDHLLLSHQTRYHRDMSSGGPETSRKNWTRSSGNISAVRTLLIGPLYRYAKWAFKHDHWSLCRSIPIVLLYLHYRLPHIIYSRMKSEPTIRHGHQLICLMKVDWFWCSEMQLHTLMSRLLIVKKTLFSSQNTKINQLSSGISAGAHV